MPTVDVVDKLLKVDKHSSAADDEEMKVLKLKAAAIVMTERTWFELAACLIIGTNAITIALETNDTITGGNNQHIFVALEMIFCIIFLAEGLIKLYIQGCGFFTDLRLRSWNVFELIIIALSVLDAFILGPLNISRNVRFVQVLRISRLLRLLRLIRLFRVFRELWVVAQSLLDSVKTIVWICVIIALFTYIVAAVFTYELGIREDAYYEEYYRQSFGAWDHRKYFKTVPHSMLTLIQAATLDDWTDGLIRQVGETHGGAVVLLVVYVCIVHFVLINVIVGTLVETTMRAVTSDELRGTRSKEAESKKMIAELRRVFDETDTDGSGSLSLAEVQVAVTKPHLRTWLHRIDFPVDSPEMVFDMLDFDDSGELSIDEFVVGSMRMQGNAKSKDLLASQFALDAFRYKLTNLGKMMEDLQARLGYLGKRTNEIVRYCEYTFLNTQQFRMRHPEHTGASMPMMPLKELLHPPWGAVGDERTKFMLEFVRRTSSSALSDLESAASESPPESNASSPTSARTSRRTPQADKCALAVVRKSPKRQGDPS